MNAGLCDSAGVQYILSNTAVWQLAEQGPEAPAEAVQIMTVAGAAPTPLLRAEEVRMSLQKPHDCQGTQDVKSQARFDYASATYYVAKPICIVCI